MFSKVRRSLWLLLCLLALSSNSLAQRDADTLALSEEKKALFSEIYYRHQKTLKNIDKENPLLIVCFSGTPGMGKTTTSKKLEEVLDAVVVSSTDIRDNLRESGLYPSITKTSFKSPDAEYFYFLLEHLPQKNGLIVLDMSIDRTYRDFIPWASQRNIPVFIIQLCLDKETTIERIKIRNRADDAEILTRIEKNFQDYEEFNKNVTVDYRLDQKDPDLEGLYKAIERKLGSDKKSITEQLKEILKNKRPKK